MTEATKYTAIEATESIKSPTSTTTTSTTGGLIVGKASIVKSSDYSLAASEQANVLIVCAMLAASKTLTLGMPTGQFAIVKNTGATNAFTVKNVAGDTGTSLATGKSMLLITSADANASIVIPLD